MGSRAAASLPAERFRLELTTYADPGDMRAWLDGARPGAVMTYACGPVLGDHPAAALAREWAGAGRAELFQQRSARAHCFDYRARARAAVAEPPTTAATPKHGLPGEALRVLCLLERAAREGAACPTTDAIATELALRSKWQARHLFDRLVHAGLVRVVEPARFGARVIEIVESGRRTAPQEATAVGGTARPQETAR